MSLLHDIAGDARAALRSERDDDYWQWRLGRFVRTCWRFVYFCGAVWLLAELFAR